MKHDAMLHYASFDVKLPNSIYSVHVISVLTLEVTTGPNSARAISADCAPAFSFPSLVTDPGKKGVIGKLIHSSSCANFIQVQNAVSPNENPR